MSVSEKIVVTGATGQLGRLVVAALLEKIPPTQVVGVVRNVSAARDLAERGIELRAASYENAPALDAALTGATKLLLISSSEVGHRAQQHHNIIEAAKRAGVKLLAYTSILHADRNASEISAFDLGALRGAPRSTDLQLPRRFVLKNSTVRCQASAAASLS